MGGKRLFGSGVDNLAETCLFAFLGDCSGIGPRLKGCSKMCLGLGLDFYFFYFLLLSKGEPNQRSIT